LAEELLPGLSPSKASVLLSGLPYLRLIEIITGLMRPVTKQAQSNYKDIPLFQ